MIGPLKQFYFTREVPNNYEAMKVMCSYGNGNEHEICVIDTNGAGDRAYSERVARMLIDALYEEDNLEIGERLTENDYSSNN